jgi:predicted phosphodiesterase
MNRQLLLTLFVCALALAAVAQAQPDIRVEVPTEAKPWTGLDLNNDPGVFRFAVVSDNAGGPREGIFAEAIAKLNLLQPEFVINVGDLIEGYEDTREALEAQWERRMAEIARLEVPFFFVPGNHDNGRPLWAEVYNARFGVPYYHFLYKDVLFLCLSTNTGPNNGTGISPEQIEYAARVLKEHPDVRWTIVFQHKPLWNENNEGWKKIEALLQGRKCTVFAGHTHNYLSQEKDGISYITLATTGGGSPLRGTAYGEFDQIAWVTMTDEGPRVANLLLDGIHDKSLRTPESAEALAVFREGRAVTATPILNEGAQFHTGATRLSIKNPADKPLRVKVLSEVPAGVRVEPSTVSMIVPPKSEEWAELKVTADQPVPLPAAQPVVLHWSAAYDSATNTPSVELSGECRVPVDGSFPVPAVESSPGSTASSTTGPACPS